MSVLILLVWKTVILSVAVLICVLLFRLWRFRSPRLERLAWCGVLLLGIFGAEFMVPVKYKEKVGRLPPGGDVRYSAQITTDDFIIAPAENTGPQDSGLPKLPIFALC